MGDTRKRPPAVGQLRLYTDLAKWWPLCSSPDEYKEEAEIYRRTLLHHSPRTPVTLLELGSGGGNNASHLKRHFKMTLVDLSPGMLRVSRKLNPSACTCAAICAPCASSASLTPSSSMMPSTTC